MKIGIGALIVLSAGKLLWDVTAEKRGELMAHRDVERGHLCVKRYGYGYEFHGDYRDEKDFLRSKYGVHLDAVAGCVVTRPLADYVRGYNSVSIPAIRKKYGRDIVEEYELVRKKKFLSMFANQLEDPDTERRRSAAAHLALNTDGSDGIDGSEYGEFVPDLVDALNDQDAEFRKWAATALRNICTTADAAIPTSRRLLNDTDTAVREATQQALMKIETPSHGQSEE